MRLVFLNQYYPPDAAPTGVMLEDLVEQLLRDGHEVSVVCAAGGYAGRADRPRSADLSPTGREANDPAVSPRPQGQSGSAEAVRPYPSLRIIRIGATKFGRGTFFGKLVDYASYYAGVAWKLLTMHPAPQRIVALTTPPYLSVLARIMSKLRGADHAHWVMDLYPDVLAAHGMLDERSLAYRLLAGLTHWGFGGKRCAAVLTLGPDMAERVSRRVVRCQLSGKTQDNKTQDARQEAESNSNIERSTSNIERRTAEDCGEEPRLGAQAPQTTRLSSPKSTDNSSSSLASCVLQSCVSSCIDNRQQTTLQIVHWVPLWGSGRSVISDQSSGKTQDNKTQDARQEAESNSNIERSTSNIERRTEEDCGEEPRHGAQAPQTTRLSSPESTDNSSSSLASCVLQSCVSSSMDNGQQTTDPALALRRARGWGDEDLVVMYSGNMGLGHRFGEILAAAGRADRPRSADLFPTGRDANDPAQSSHPPGGSGRGEAAPPYRSSPAAGPRLRFVFFGGGKRRDEVERFAHEHPQAGVELYDYAPADNLMAHLQSADVHLASLDPAWTGTMVPSKLQGIFAAARPVIFIGCAASSIGRWVSESGGGWVVAGGDVAGLLAALAEAREPTVRATRGRAAREFAMRHFDPHRNVARVAQILTAAR